MMGERADGDAGVAVLRVQPGAPRPVRPPAPLDRPLRRPLRRPVSDPAAPAPVFSPIGRPSIDPELMIRMLIVGYCFGIRSERRLCEEVHLNLAYRWFCRLGLEGDVPDHSTFSKTRHGRFRDSDLLRALFEATVRRCMAEGLVGGEQHLDLLPLSARSDVGVGTSRTSRTSSTGCQREALSGRDELGPSTASAAGRMPRDPRAEDDFVNGMLVGHY